MALYSLFCLIVVFAVCIHYLNDRLLKIQSTIAITVGAVVTSAVFALAHQYAHFDASYHIEGLLKSLDFKDLLLNGMLGFLLFAGALTVDLKALLKFKWEVGTLATLGTIASTLLVGYVMFYTLPLINLHLTLLQCMIFGALISPTDPIAVLATVKNINAPKDLETKIAGESLFNDGVGLVIFVTLYTLAFSGHTPTVSETVILFLREAVGGFVFGLTLGAIAYFLIKPLNDSRLEILITICIASAGYVFAQHLHISGPLAMVVAGLIVGNVIRERVLSTHGQNHLDIVWEVIEELLNAVLFLLIGLELMVVHVQDGFIIAGLIAIPLVLIIRFITVALPMSCFKVRRRYVPFVISILTWGGLRGGLALAMALSLPKGNFRDLILVMTFGVVLFAIIIQGLTAKPLVKLSKS